jgi:hypothetical protein
MDLARTPRPGSRRFAPGQIAPARGSAETMVRAVVDRTNRWLAWTATDLKGTS